MNQIDRQPSARRAAPRQALALKAIASAVALWMGAHAAQAAGVGVVTSGSGSIATQGAVTTVQQQSQGLRIDWSRFQVGAGETLAFVQPNAKSVAVNVVNGSLPAEILGQLTANGNVFVLSPNGLLIGAGGSVNVGSHFVASTGAVDTFDPLTGALKTRATQGAAGQIINAGTITAGQGGIVALSGPQVINSGTINAPGGQVLLLAGDRVVFKSNENSVISYVVNAATVASSVTNSGRLSAQGGRVELDARSLVSSVVNTSGVIEAGGVEGGDGVIRLTALGPSASITASGIIDAGDSGSVTARLGSGGQLNYSAVRSTPIELPVLLRIQEGEQTRTIGVVANDKTYDGTTAATVDIQLSDLVSGDTLALAIDQVDFDGPDADVGLQVFLSLADFSTTSLSRTYALQSDLSAAILTKQIGVIVDTKVYDGTNTAVVRVNEDDIIAADRNKLRVTLGQAVFDDENAGSDKTVTYASGLGGGGLTPGNYHLSNEATGTITRKQITTSVETKEYDGNTSATVTVNQNDIIEADRGKVNVTLANANFDNKNAGSEKLVTYQAGLSGAGVRPDNYEVATSATGTITPKALTITANNASKVQDGVPYTGGNGVTANGLVTGETLADLQGVLAYGGNSQGAQAAGNYVIAPGGLNSGNYQIAYQNGSLAIAARTSLDGVGDAVGNVNNGGSQTTPINVDLAGLGDVLSQLPATAAGEDDEDPEKVKTRRRSDRSPVRVMDGGVKVPATLR